METTIAVKESTAQILSRIKERMKTKSIDETIMKILHKSKEIQKSRFGATPRLKEFSHKERAHAHEL